MKGLILRGTFATLIVFLMVMPAMAITVGFMPSSQTVNPGPLSVDIVVSGLTAANEIVSAYDLNVAYNSSILTATGVILGSLLGNSIQNVSILSGAVDLTQVSLESPQTLEGLQGDSVTLATLTFNAIGVGTSPLSWVDTDVYGINQTALSLTSNNGSVTVGTAAIPEPTTMILLGSGLLGLWGARRKFRK